MYTNRREDTREVSDRRQVESSRHTPRKGCLEYPEKDDDDDRKPSPDKVGDPTTPAGEHPDAKIETFA